MKHIPRLVRAVVLVVVVVAVVAAVIAAVTRTVTWLPRGLLAIYFPPFLVTGSPDLWLLACTVFLVVAAFLVFRRKYWAALASLVLPIAAAWIFAWRLMGG